MEVYFDNAATTSVRKEAIAVMVNVMEREYGNPSSTHYLGRRAAIELEKARKNVAAALGAQTNEIYFTSGGTEADNWAILACAEARSRQGKHIITSTIEHDAVMEPVKKLAEKGWEVTYLEPDAKGRVSAEAFAEALREDTVLATLMLVNNETGAINPVGEYSREIKRRRFGTILHTDAVQGLCKIPFTAKTLGVQLMTVSAHKLHGPKGVGALYIKEGLKLPPLIAGGGQENGRRSGTEALPAIAGFGEAARLGKLEQEESLQSVRELYDYLTSEIKEELPMAVIISEGDSPFILNLSLPGYKSEVLISFLEGEKICASKSAACKKGSRSRVLEAMRLKNDIIDGAIRISFSRFNTQEEAWYFVQTLKKATQRLRIR